MSFLLPYIEYTFSTLLHRVRGHDSGLFTSTPPFSTLPPSITITSPSLGSSPATLRREHTQDGASLFPDLTWPSTPGVAEWVLVVEDPDAPLPSPILHGIYYGIPGGVTAVRAGDFEDAGGSDGSGKWRCRGGWRYGKGARKGVYTAPRPLVGHGVHRYVFQLVGLREAVEDVGEGAGKEEVKKAVEEKVVAWGSWVGGYERKWK
ncbi:phosphatidylethanolamine-binding protein [Geopyxis carbonaria]|nr:phosphatidylethanolamine-binding protein [Geopyxis carbonaria]